MFETGYSKVRSARRCWKQYDYKYNQNLQRRRPAPPLIRGTIIHEMLDARARLSMGQKKLPDGTPLDTIPQILAKYEKKYGTLFREEREEYGETFMADIKRVIDSYERTYLEDEFKFEASEEEVETQLTKDIVFKGHLDKRLVDERGRRWIMDHKTHKSIPDENARFADYQILLYLWAYNREHPKAQADGILWDYLRTKAPTIPEQLKNGQLTQRANLDSDYATYAKELRRLKLDPKPYMLFMEELKKRSARKFFLRVPLPAPPKVMVDSVVSDFKVTSIAMANATVFPRTMTKDCSWCEYYKLCMSELRGLDASFVRKAEYEEKKIGDENSEED
jgi:hypothetical protein